MHLKAKKYKEISNGLDNCIDLYESVSIWLKGKDDTYKFQAVAFHEYGYKRLWYTIWPKLYLQAMITILMKTLNVQIYL